MAPHANHAVSPRPLPSVLLLSLIPAAAWFIVRPLLEPVPALPALYTSFGCSVFAFLITLYLVPRLGPTFVQAGFKGRDLLKIYDTPMYANKRNIYMNRNNRGAENLLYVQTRKLGSRMRIGLHPDAHPLYPCAFHAYTLQAPYTP
jgi:hypothetical protein